MVTRARGFSLVEVLVAVAVTALMGMPFLELIGNGAESTARAGESEVAALIAARMMDRFAGAGFDALAPKRGPERDLNMRQTGEPTATTAARSVADVDGVLYSGRWRIEPVNDALLRVTVRILWRKSGRAGAAQPGMLEVMRYVADPLAGCRARAPGGAS